jgi:hypothetical protein
MKAFKIIVTVLMYAVLNSLVLLFTLWAGLEIAWMF